MSNFDEGKKIKQFMKEKYKNHMRFSQKKRWYYLNKRKAIFKKKSNNKALLTDTSTIDFCFRYSEKVKKKSMKTDLFFKIIMIFS